MVRAAFAAILVCWVYDSACLHAADHAPGQFEHHADVQIQVFAQEPNIVDPVSLTFAANGDCFVVEMRDYPIVQAVTRVNHPEQAGHFSSSGGMGILNSSLFSPRLANSIFVCDVVCNIVHRDVLREDGPVFRAARAPEEQTSEFIASRDPAFRPVGLEHGPDGAMYLIAMQRDVVEHPDYIPAAVRDKLDIRA